MAVEIEKRLEGQWRHLYEMTNKKLDIATSELIEHQFLPQELLVLKMMVNHVNGLRVSENPYLYDRTTMIPLFKKIHEKLAEFEMFTKSGRMIASEHPTSTGVWAFVRGILYWI
ncbi:hypothetical protein AHF37_12568 [Paragonimus kellicotti]|nr:hypothetical protein AHF37_12568 [Paragonimus kellicotti]